MYNSEAKQILTETLSKILVGNLSSTSNLNPSIIIEALIEKVEFGSAFSQKTNRELYIEISKKQQEYNNELTILQEQELSNNSLTANFLRGKIEFAEEVLELLKQTK